ncbi:hypothetical protein SAMN02745857_02779 [Andreprevotia lacus DSM 23236]|jgi:hypothetical protein|uniref:Uncharacterized protein n=1 Tax=Andreprevotia lacus DSM 23236 TaxID=1121001 RepID=A0A1W1XUQ7_9NEIS|nr:hypothetical protein [Andreprevotia lacus]SMC27271.1 hypothetical protein SAMN02745857_02779 [Andreprevotia lacus DSM 23236]
MNDAGFRLILFTAFLGAVREGVRAIAYACDGHTLAIHVYLARAPEPDDHEVVDIAITEVMAACPQIMQQDIVLQHTMAPIGRLPAHQGWIFVRSEAGA